MSEPAAPLPPDADPPENNDPRPRTPVPMSDGSCLLMFSMVGFIIFAMIFVTSWYLFVNHFEGKARPLAEGVLTAIQAGNPGGAAAAIGPRAFPEEPAVNYAAKVHHVLQEHGPLLKWKFKGSGLHRLPDKGRLINLKYNATFEKGTGMFWIQAVGHDGVWRLTFMDFKSDNAELNPPEASATPLPAATPGDQAAQPVNP